MSYFKKDDAGRVLVDAQGYTTTLPGRERLHADNAARQAAYRRRKREREAEEAERSVRARQERESALRELWSAVEFAASGGDAHAKRLARLSEVEALRDLADWFRGRGRRL